MFFPWPISRSAIIFKPNEVVAQSPTRGGYVQVPVAIEVSYGDIVCTDKLFIANDMTFPKLAICRCSIIAKPKYISVQILNNYKI